MSLSQLGSDQHESQEAQDGVARTLSSFGGKRGAVSKICFLSHSETARLEGDLSRPRRRRRVGPADEREAAIEALFRGDRAPVDTLAPGRPGIGIVTFLLSHAVAWT